jgi:glycosyltransferase involved in cell wall biosynthesis
VEFFNRVIVKSSRNAEIFNTEASKDLSLFRSQYNLTKPYVMMVGSREQHKSYKNVKLFFEAIASSKSASLEILCVGGEGEINPEWLASLPGDVRATRRDLSDRELATAYAGAAALVYPSLYEGFGMPVIEAMASGCPVITTHHGSLAEVAGEAALIISGHDHCEMLSAFHRVQEPAQRRRLIEAGIKQAALYNWDETGERFQELLSQAHDERLDPDVINFHRRWKELRSAQADVDVGID